MTGEISEDEDTKGKPTWVEPPPKVWGTPYTRLMEFEIGLTPHKLQAKEFRRVLKYGIGLTDIAKKHSGVDASIPTSAYEPAIVRDKILLYKPMLLAFNGKEAARRSYGWKRTEQVGYGPQEVWVRETQV